jgi:hypothetical protein
MECGFRRQSSRSCSSASSTVSKLAGQCSQNQYPRAFVGIPNGTRTRRGATPLLSGGLLGVGAVRVVVCVPRTSKGANELASPTHTGPAVGEDDVKDEKVVQCKCDTRTRRGDPHGKSSISKLRIENSQRECTHTARRGLGCFPLVLIENSTALLPIKRNSHKSESIPNDSDCSKASLTSLSGSRKLDVS